jgi:hypothetical protein
MSYALQGVLLDNDTRWTTEERPSDVSDNAVFDGARFSDNAVFDAATFAGPTAFAGTDFGNGAIAFDNPRQWGPPAPTFDWDGDPSTKPENVTPQSWPPTPVA